MSFTFNTTIPAAANDPSVDQPNMLINNVSINGILAVDHVTFNAANGGQHLQVTLPATAYVVPGAQTGNASVIYPNTGTASTAAQLFYVNSNATVQLSAIRAWALCTPAGITASQSVNVASVIRTPAVAAGDFTITLTANSVSSANFAVLVSTGPTTGTGGLTVNYAITGATTFRIQFRAIGSGGSQPLTDPTSFSFQVLQI